MGIATLLDAAVIAPAAILGLLGVWLGLARLLVAGPMRWLIPLFGAGAVALPAMLYLVVNGKMAADGRATELLGLSGTVLTMAAGGIASLVTLALLRSFMSNLRERVAVWTHQRRIGFLERVFGGVLGTACGLLLAAIVVVAYAPMRRATADEPAWVRESVLLPYFRSAADAIERALLPYPDGPTRAER